MNNLYDFDIRTREMLKVHAPEAAEKYKNDYDNRVASLPSHTNGNAVAKPQDQTAEPKEEPAIEPKEEPTIEVVADELISLQEQYFVKFGKKVPWMLKTNAERIKGKLTE